MFSPTQHELWMLNRTDALRVRLEECTIKTIPRDMLSKYRQWLDKNKINAEVDGWPSSEAFDEANIERFAEWWNDNYSEAFK
jgi:hypothetical protein